MNDYTDFNSLTDETYFPEGHQWDQGAVWWDAQQSQSANNSLTVYLGDIDCNVKHLSIQADNRLVPSTLLLKYWA